MTFYWWSHWFWITCLSVQLLSSHVHTYPSGQQAASRQTTKLYQTTVSQTWSTATQSNIMDLTNKPTAAAAAVTPVYTGEDEQEDEIQAEDEQHEDLLLNDDEEQQQQAAAADVEVQQSVAQYEFKRSADYTSEQLNNFTNFSSSTSTNASSSSTLKPALNSNSPVTTTTTTAATTATTTTAATSTSSSAASSLGTTTAAATSTEATATTGVVMAVAAAAATMTTPSLTSSSSSATPSTPKINTEWLSDELLAHGEKAPFTLENANKEDELRRAESEHRSRKSKVLSAEYKHINRYINYSSDTKSLLTRSASLAPSLAADGGYDGGANDEGNISSEALAIQRTYFLDAGAISAICFTVFGICCTVGTIGIVLYRRRFLNKPQALSEPDSSVYIDDSTMRDNSDEMYSLDNDSFLNSLEAMTIQNYWTDTVKHTKL